MACGYYHAALRVFPSSYLANRVDASAPEEENKPLVWPYWPLKLRTSSSHEEGCVREFAVSTKEFIGGTGKDAGKLTVLKTVHIELKDGKMVEIPGTEKTYKADMVFLAMGFVSPVASVIDTFGIDKDNRGNAKAHTEFTGGYATNVPKVFAAGAKLPKTTSGKVQRALARQMYLNREFDETEMES